MDSQLKYRALKLRKNDTRAETILWNMLRNRKLKGFKFRRQYIIEPYIVDFICLKKNLIIELDGDHHEQQKEYDAKRTRYLQSNGYKVIRFRNSELFNKDEQVLTAISNSLLT